ncbi:hypothetical protein SS50377_26843 [Spironucleus salmonicida]|uniref:Uncharacterized protein n=1 Tax=Spironucleus salmonicida TaxID=348837 RepID=V6LZX3_9EUKA|nr:hypothetical protein SS50377_26843 [Spironucleus salmonicida]|eukprot:EST49311.1 Hypothetical protein SS50377_10536 [Spironucleus salmonicida]
MEPLAMALQIHFKQDQITGELTFMKPLDCILEFLVDTLQILSFTADDIQQPLVYNNKLIVDGLSDQLIQIKFITYNPCQTLHFPQLLYLRINLKPTITSDFGTVIYQNSQFARNIQFLVIPPNLLQNSNIQYESQLVSQALELQNFTKQKIVVLKGSYQAKYIDQIYILYVPVKSSKAVIQLLKAAQIVLPIIQIINLAPTALSSIFCQALLYHFFFGYVAASNFAEFQKIYYQLLCVNIEKPHQIVFHSQFSTRYFPYSACLALATTSLQEVQLHPLFAHNSSQNAHNDMLRSNFDLEKTAFCAKIFPKKGIEPGDLLKSAVELVPKIDLNCENRRFLILGDQEFIISFVGACDWQFKLNKLKNLYNNNKINNVNLTIFNQIVQSANLNIKDQFGNLQIYSQLFNSREGIEGKVVETDKLVESQCVSAIITLSESFYNKHFIKQDMYNDQDLEKVASPTEFFKKYAKDQVSSIIVTPIYYEQIQIQQNKIIQMLLQFNYQKEDQQIADLDKLAMKLFEVFRNSILNQFSKQSFETNFISFKQQFIEYKSLFNNDQNIHLIFNLIEDIKRFLRGICLNIQNCFELREKAVFFLVYLDDLDWLYKILEYLEKRFDSCLFNQDNQTLRQINQLIDSMWLGVVIWKREDYLLTLLNNDMFDEKWLARLSHNKISTYLISELSNKIFNTELYTSFLLYQIFYHDQFDLLQQIVNPTTIKLQLLEILTIYPIDVNQQIQSFIEINYNQFSVSQFVQNVSNEYNLPDYYQVWKLSKMCHKESNNQILSQFLGQFDFLEWNLEILPKILKIRPNLQNFSDYSCYNCYFGSCQCDVKSSLERMNGNKFDFEGYQYIGSILNEDVEGNMDIEEVGKQETKLQMYFGDILLHERLID